MTMPAIGFGVPTVTYSGVNGAVTQSIGFSPATDSYPAKDENGNTCLLTERDHRITGTVEALWPAGASVPFAGQTVRISNITLPTVTSAGVVTGSFSLSGTDSALFRVASAPTLSTSNTDYQKLSLTVERYLVNGIPDTSY